MSTTIDRLRPYETHGMFTVASIVWSYIGASSSHVLVRLRTSSPCVFQGGRTVLFVFLSAGSIKPRPMTAVCCG